MINDLTDNRILEYKSKIEELLDLIYADWDRELPESLKDLVYNLNTTSIKLTEEQVIRFEQNPSNNNENWII